MESKSEVQHFEYIDALRGLAILMVIATHAGQIVRNPPDFFLFLTSKGVYGVQLFFIVSALTLSLSYQQRLPKDGKDAGKFFFLRRFFRIAPAFYLAIVFYIPVLLLQNHILHGAYGTIDGVKIVIFTLFLGIFYPPAMYYLPFAGWTVDVEMFFYLFVPLLYRKVKTLGKAVWFFIVTTGVFVALNYLFTRSGSSLNKYTDYLVFPAQLPIFAVGIICFHILKQNWPIKKITAGVLLLFSAIFLAVVLWLSKQYPFLPEPILVSLGLGGVVLSMAMRPIRFLQNRVTEFVGKVSYSLYLWHFVFMLFFWYAYKSTDHFHNLNPLVSFGIIFFATVIFGSAVSYVSYRLVETQGIAWGKKLIKRLTVPKSEELNGGI